MSSKRMPAKGEAPSIFFGASAPPKKQSPELAGAVEAPTTSVLSLRLYFKGLSVGF